MYFFVDNRSCRSNNNIHYIGGSSNGGGWREHQTAVFEGWSRHQWIQDKLRWSIFCSKRYSDRGFHSDIAHVWRASQIKWRPVDTFYTLSIFIVAEIFEASYTCRGSYRCLNLVTAFSGLQNLENSLFLGKVLESLRIDLD